MTSDTNTDSDDHDKEKSKRLDADALVKNLEYITTVMENNFLKQLG